MLNTTLITLIHSNPPFSDALKGQIEKLRRIYVQLKELQQGQEDTETTAAKPYDPAIMAGKALMLGMNN